LAVSAVSTKEAVRAPYAPPCQRKRLPTLTDTTILQILDVGCGPGTITADLASLVPKGHVTGLEYAPEVLTQARSTAAQRGLTNIEFVVGDVNGLDFPDGTFDVVHAHQVLVHVGDPVQALREMRRVAKPGGIVARVVRSNGAEPNAGRRLHVWARLAGIDPIGITATASTWCYRTPEERAWWSGLWAERIVATPFARSAVSGGYATEQDLAGIAQAWRDWGADEDGWFAVLHGEIICRV
ncbi:S-adenosyl-L-methionine-dependent methyltransferase, partial [Gautieria morchelliformis]